MEMSELEIEHFLGNVSLNKIQDFETRFISEMITGLLCHSFERQ